MKIIEYFHFYPVGKNDPTAEYKRNRNFLLQRFSKPFKNAFGNELKFVKENFKILQFTNELNCLLNELIAIKIQSYDNNNNNCLMISDGNDIELPEDVSKAFTNQKFHWKCFKGQLAYIYALEGIKALYNIPKNALCYEWRAFKTKTEDGDSCDNARSMKLISTPLYNINDISLAKIESETMQAYISKFQQQQRKSMFYLYLFK